ncbi:UNKNOWN [Stylonychia lemnae]|uniref:Uncharacterized protein n=1 Tax=Stylonychia lemnae TaxID=5949 RepID=A0A078AWD7_STYLE|nr:UNKNOWN [Stylonychia lemnae]|eukprot:CDW86780.1 UNKNOWN [Stylonychia lemnae]
MSETQDVNKLLTDFDEQKKSQQERIEHIKTNLTPMNRDFIRKELMLNIDIDVNNLVDPNLFDNFYELKNKKKEDKLAEVKREEGRVQGVGIGIGFLFLIARAKQRDVKWLLPGIVAITGTKYYSSKLFFQRLQEYQIDDYWRKSKKLDGDLRKVDGYIKQRKFFEKYGPNSSL